MKAAEKEYKKSKVVIEDKKYIKQSSEVLPEWFDKKIEKKKISEENEKSLKDMLKEFS